MLHVNDLVHHIEGRRLFDQATIALSAGTKAGLIGRNGSGKTTLLRLIKGDLSPDAGSVNVRKGARVGAVDQEAPGGAVSVLDTVLAADAERAALLAEAETAIEPHRIADIQTRLTDIEAHSAEARAAEILAGVGFAQADLARPCSEFSGGWRMRIALAAMLFAKPDLLLLDEPTNYLDLEGAVWLETHLKRYPAAALVVSHDRDLLNASVDQIVHLREGKLFGYPGGYDEFERVLAEQQTLQFKLKERQEAERRRLQAFVDRFRAKASKARQAQSRVKRLEKMKPVATMVESPVAPFDFPKAPRAIAPPIIRLEGVAVGYESNRPVLQGLDLRIDDDDRIGLLGRNGAGKSTFAKLLCDRLTPLSGHMRKHKKLQVAFFAQHQIEDLNPKLSAYHHVVERLPEATEAQRRARLGRFGLEQSKAETPAGDLSGGERARLLMHLVTFDGAHLLILDEPTNHLDMDSRAALVDALNAFEGAVLLVTHDRHLIESCVDRLWLAADGGVAPFEGDMEDYRALVSGRSTASGSRAIKPTTVKGEARRDAAARRAHLIPLKKEAQRWESEVSRLTTVIATIDKGLAALGLYQQDPTTAADLSKKRARAVALLVDAERKWLDAAETLEVQTAESGHPHATR